MQLAFPEPSEDSSEASVKVVFDKILSLAADVDIFEKTSAISGSVRSFLAGSTFDDEFVDLS